MTRRPHPALHSFLRRLRPSAASIAGAAATYDPASLLALQAAQHERGNVAPTPLREPRTGAAPRGWRLNQETAGALLLMVAVALALLWSNGPWAGSYTSFWHAPIGIRAGSWTLAASLRTWVNEGLMTLFFLSVGLEAKHERDLGALREGRRMAVPALAGLIGMITSAAVYLAVTGGGYGAGGWGVALSTDTALALGALTIAAGKAAPRLRAFLLTILVVDDLVALAVISFVYPSRIHSAALIVAAGLFTALLTMRAVAGRQFRARGDSTAILTPLSMLTGAALWLALFESGFDPVVTGLVIGLLTNAFEPKPQLSPNDRLQHRLRPWTTMLVVPIFALANAGLRINGHLLATAVSSPIAWGIVLAYLVGKPLGIILAARTFGRHTLGDLKPDELRGVALTTAIAFTLSLLIASRAFSGELLAQAKVGILVTALLAPLLASLALAPRRHRGSSEREGRAASKMIESRCVA
jgi:Na+/H+ antiporter NhaA